jgi:hypothetical protein
LLCFDYTTPVRHESQNAFDVPRSRDNRKLLEGLAVDIDLAAEPIEAIFGALDLVTVDAAVDHSNVNTAPRMGEAEFVDD